MRKPKEDLGTINDQPIGEISHESSLLDELYDPDTKEWTPVVVNFYHVWTFTPERSTHD